jgi:hypothetical protein
MRLRTQTLDQFDCGGGFPLVSECRGRIFREWRQLSDAIAALSTSAHGGHLEQRARRAVLAADVAGSCRLIGIDEDDRRTYPQDGQKYCALILEVTIIDHGPYGWTRNFCLPLVSLCLPDQGEQR